MDVLVVEDEALLREAVAEGLQRAGLDVAAADAAEAALAAVARAAPRPPPVLVTDIRLGPGMDGLALAAAVCGRWPQVGVVFITGDPRALRGHACGARERCLFKPFAPAALAEMVRGLAPSNDAAAPGTASDAAASRVVQRGAIRKPGARGAGGRMYVAALAGPLEVEYLLLDPVQHALARAHPGGLCDFVRRTPALRDPDSGGGGAPRFRDLGALREHCRAHGIRVMGDLHGCWGETGPPRPGSGLF